MNSEPESIPELELISAACSELSLSLPLDLKVHGNDSDLDKVDGGLKVFMLSWEDVDLLRTLLGVPCVTSPFIKFFFTGPLRTLKENTMK